MDSIRAKAPALWSAVAISLGILCGYFVMPDMKAAWLAALMAATALTVWFMARKVRRGELTLAAVCFYVGIYLGAASHSNPFDDSLDRAKGTLTGRVERVSFSEHYTRVAVNVLTWTPRHTDSTLRTDFNTVCIISGHHTDIEKGSTITARGKLLALDPTLDLPDQLDYNRYLFIDGVTSRMHLYAWTDYSFDNSTLTGWQRFVSGVRHRWLGAIRDAGFDAGTGAFLTAVLGGSDVAMDEELERQLRENGLSHLLAISGMHVSILLMVLAVLLLPLKLVRRGRNVYFVVVCALLLLYGLATGGSPSACRAVAMGCVILGNRMLEVRTNLMQALSVAVVILLILNPMWLFLPGFQLSVCAMLGIIAAIPLYDTLAKHGRVVSWIGMTVVTPVVAVLATLIPTAVYFNTLSLNFWLANILTAIFIMPLVAAGFVGTLGALTGIYVPGAAPLADTLYSWVRAVVNFVDTGVDAGHVDIFLSIPQMIAFVAFAGACAWLIRHYSHRRLVVTATLAAAAFFLLPEDDAAMATAELYVPRHYTTTDIILVHDGKAYLWTTADDEKEISTALDLIERRYSRYFMRRDMDTAPHILKDGYSKGDVEVTENTLRIGSKSLVRIDDSTPVPDGRHFDVAIVTDRFTGDIRHLAARLDVDTLLLSTAINPSRLAKFERHLENADITWRNMTQRGLTWRLD